MIQGNKKEIKEMTLEEWAEMMTGTEGQLDKHLLFSCLRTAFAISAQYVASRVRKSSQTIYNYESGLVESRDDLEDYIWPALLNEIGMKTTEDPIDYTVIKALAIYLEEMDQFYANKQAGHTDKWDNLKFAQRYNICDEIKTIMYDESRLLYSKWEF